MKDLEAAPAPRRMVRRWAQVVVVLGSVIVLGGLLLPWPCEDAAGTICQTGLRLSRSATELGETVRTALTVGVIWTLVMSVFMALRGEPWKMGQVIGAVVVMSLGLWLLYATSGPGHWLGYCAFLTVVMAYTSGFERDLSTETGAWYVRGAAIVTFLIALVLWLSTVGKVAISVAPGPLVALIGATIMMVVTFPDIVTEAHAASPDPEHPTQLRDANSR